MRLKWIVCAVALALLSAPLLAADDDDEDKPRRFPLMAEEARKRGYTLPEPFGVGLVYYKLQRDIKITEVRVGRNGAPLKPVPQFAQFSSTSDVDNLNVKADMWLLPFLNVYAIVGGIKNKSDTTLDIGLPPLTPDGPARRQVITVPTKLNGSVGGLGITFAGGYKSFFAAGDINVAKADIGFDDRFRAVVASARLGWIGEIDGRPWRVWSNATHWDTFATAKGTVTDSDGGTLKFEVDQGPAYPWTYGAGFSWAARKNFEFSVDTGSDFHGGWYIAIVPVYRF